MKIPRLFRTTALRLALRYAILYAALTGLALGALYWKTSQFIDTQIAAGLDDELQALMARFQSQGQAGLIRALEARIQADTGEGFYLLLGPDGRRLAGNFLEWPPEIPLDGAVHNVWVEDDAVPGERYQDDAYWPVVATELADGSRLLLAHEIRRADALQGFIEMAILFVFVLTLVLALGMGLIMGYDVLRRIDAINRTAAEIMAGDLSQRMSLSGRGDEFDQMASRLNAMLERIDRLMAGMRQVTDNVAHDLRSPLTRLRNRLEVTLLERRSEAEYRAAMEQAVRDADGLVKTFNALLEIAQTEARNRRSAWEPFVLTDLARDVAELYGPLAEEKGLVLDLDLQDEAPIHGSRHLIAQALGNLLDNAIKFTPAGGRVRLAVAPSGARIALIVEDTGPGIPAADRDRVTRRFVRLDAARHTPGNGLGLSLVKAVAALHGARLTLSDRKPGLRVELAFPTHPGVPGQA